MWIMLGRCTVLSVVFTQLYAESDCVPLSDFKHKYLFKINLTHEENGSVSTLHILDTILF